jgi:hypothetical protein
LSDAPALPARETIVRNSGNTPEVSIAAPICGQAGKLLLPPAPPSLLAVRTQRRGAAAWICSKASVIHRRFTAAIFLSSEFRKI